MVKIPENFIGHNPASGRNIYVIGGSAADDVVERSYGGRNVGVPIPPLARVIEEDDTPTDDTPTDDTPTDDTPTDVTFAENGDIQYAVGSLIRATSQAHLGLSGEKEIYSTQDHANGVYVRNVNRIAPTTDLTCISPWNSFGANQRAGVAITTRHIYFAEHFTLRNNDLVRFITNDNQVVTRTCSNVVDLGGDLGMATLDSDLPSTIKPAKVMPANVADYFTAENYQYGALFGANQHERLITKRVFNFASNANGGVVWAPATFAPFAPFAEAFVNNDSGSPTFFIIDDEVVAFAEANVSVAGAGIHRKLPEIESYVNQTGHSLTYQSLEGLTNYAS